MTIKLIRFEEQGQEPIFLEVDPVSTTGEELASVDGVIGKAKESLERTLGPVADIIRSVVSSIRPADLGIDEVEIEFGLKFSAEAGVVISKASTEASLVVKAAWKGKEKG